MVEEKLGFPNLELPKIKEINQSEWCDDGDEDQRLEYSYTDKGRRLRFRQDQRWRLGLGSEAALHAMRM
ncbi:hypothetical protein L2E82_51437 [Cichorium intybus]|nr:hypothetical protein L2E82_51437 [Cichorium intybus]